MEHFVILLSEPLECALQLLLSPSRVGSLVIERLVPLLHLLQQDSYIFVGERGGRRGSRDVLKLVPWCQGGLGETNFSPDGVGRKVHQEQVGPAGCVRLARRGKKEVVGGDEGDEAVARA